MKLRSKIRAGTVHSGGHTKNFNHSAQRIGRMKIKTNIRAGTVHSGGRTNNFNHSPQRIRSKAPRAR